MSAASFVRCIVLAVAAIVLGFVGAAAFHPDDGWLIRSEPVWQVFGLTVYAGALALPILLVAEAASLVVRLCERRHTRPLP